MRKILLTIMSFVILFALFSIPTISADTDANHISHYVIDYDSGYVLSQYNENERHEIASMVKIMTLNIVFDEIDSGRISMDDMVTVSSHAASIGGSKLFIDAGNSYSVGDLIKGVIVVSANDAATALSEHIANNEDNFVTIMNNKASEWGMTNTHFVNVTGLPKDGQFSTARDVSIMTKHLLGHKEVFDYSTIWTEDYTHPSGRVTNLTNTNKLVRFYEGCDAGKTGYTDKAGYCLSCTALRDGMRVITTVIGCDTSKHRFKVASDLMNSAFKDYSYKVIKRHGDDIENNVQVRGGKDRKVILTYKDDVKVLMGRDNDSSVELEYSLPDTIKAPIRVGDIVGKCHVLVDGKPLRDIDIVAACDVKKGSIFDNIRLIVTK